MTDKERILMLIATTNIKQRHFGGPEDVGFGHRRKLGDIKVGDFVLAMTSGIHNFSIGEVVEIRNNHDMTLKELWGDKKCNIGNEMFVKIDKSELPSDYMLIGHERELYRKAMKAFKWADLYIMRYRGIRFEGNRCYMKVGKCFSTETMEFDFEWSPKTSIKYIKSQIIKAYEENYSPTK